MRAQLLTLTETLPSRQTCLVSEQAPAQRDSGKGVPATSQALKHDPPDAFDS